MEKMKTFIYIFREHFCSMWFLIKYVSFRIFLFDQRYVNVEVESGSFPRGTLVEHLTIHLSQDLVTYCQAQSDTLRVKVLVCLFYLAKDLEQFAPIFLVYTNAGVFHRKANPHGIFE